MTQIELHKKIDSIILGGPSQVTQSSLVKLINEPDLKDYFFAKADISWLSWLWENKLLDVIKGGITTDHNKYIAELDYFVRMAEVDPGKVVDILMSISISVDKENYRIIERYLWICGKLPAEQLMKLISKIKKEEWLKTLSIYNHYGFEFDSMFKTLRAANKYESIIDLADIVLSVRAKDEIEKKENLVITDTPFYLSDLSHTNVFEHLSSVDDQNLETAFRLVTDKMREVILLGEKDHEVFEIDEMFRLYDVDFFTLNLNDKDRLEYQNDVRQLAALLKVFIEKFVVKDSQNSTEVRRIYETCIKDLPDSWTIWRFKLYVFSLRPTVFVKEIRDALFRIFNYERPGSLSSGAEYEHLIQNSFSVLLDKDQREYIAKIIKWFSEQDWKQTGNDILSAAYTHLTEDEKRLGQEKFGTLKPDFKPEPYIGPITSGTVNSRSAGTDNDWQASIADLVVKLKNEWSSKQLKDRPENRDFFQPVDADGTAERLKAEMKVRPSEFIQYASLFFDRGQLEPHYTYKFLQGIDDLLKARTLSSDTNFTGLITLISNIVNEGSRQPFEDIQGETRLLGWLAGWDAVHMALTDVIQRLLGESEDKTVINVQDYRVFFVSSLKYLLSYTDPELKDEKLETAKSKTLDHDTEGYVVSDPFTTAINSVRGRAFQALVTFVYRDGAKLKDKPVKIEDDIKIVYEDVLKKETTQALMFMFGHYLPSFYFRDIAWIQGLLPTVFPMDERKSKLYVAAWEGYISNSLYHEIFFDQAMQELYSRAIIAPPEDLGQRRHFRDLDEGLATHLALAFVYFEEFGFEHPLFKTFWEKGAIEQHSYFISFIGRSAISGDNVRLQELLDKESFTKARIMQLWDWMLGNYKESKPFTQFGFWINLDKDIFKQDWLVERVRKTLEKTNGIIDWDYGLARSIAKLAENFPEESLKITRLYMLEGYVRQRRQSNFLHMEDEWFEVIGLLYNKPSTKQETYRLIDDLIREGGRMFWKLKDILGE